MTPIAKPHPGAHPAARDVTDAESLVEGFQVGAPKNAVSTNGRAAGWGRRHVPQTQYQSRTRRRLPTSMRNLLRNWPPQRARIPMTDASPGLLVHELAKSFPTVHGALDILTGANLAMVPGDAISITGPSGSGKSTLLYIVGLLDAPTSGTVTINGSEPLNLTPTQQAAYRSQHIGFVFQDHHLLPQCTVLENVLIPTLAGTGDADAATKRARQLLERVGLNERLHHRPAQLSGGERQRVAVCRALINQPLLLLADEPTGNLDQQTASGVGSLLLQISEEESAMLICVTHSEELAQRFPRQLQLTGGKLINDARSGGVACL